MMVQATVPTALGLLFTPWLFDAALSVAAIVTALAITGMLILLRRNALTPVRLALFASLYLVFALGIWLIRTH
jgi:cation:H+ antiporter